MPASITTIDSDQRDGLYELVRNHLGSIEDFWVALERTKNFAAAERMGKEFAEDFRLLEDIGWSEYDARETYVLTMPAPELRKLLWRLRDEAARFSSSMARRLNDGPQRRCQSGTRQGAAARRPLPEMVRRQAEAWQQEALTDPALRHNTGLPIVLMFLGPFGVRPGGARTHRATQ